MKNSLLLCLGLFFLSLFPLSAQDTIAFMPSPSLDFIKRGANMIHDQESLLPFYEKLYTLKLGGNYVVNLLHIGDSHIQGDYLTGATRSLLQQEFGNAGLGLSFPGRAAHTNESPYLYSTTKGEWETNKMNASQNKPWGIGGTTLVTSGVGNTITLKVTSHDYSFNRMTLFFQKDFNSYTINVKDSSGQVLAVAGSFTEETPANVSRLILPFSVNEIELETNQTLSIQKQFTFYGASFENSKPGIRYHITGTNGARFRHFVSSQDLIHEIGALDAMLIIISLGTNEASDYPNIDPNINSQLNQLVNGLKKANPNSILLLTTPADFYIKSTHRNPGVATVSDIIIEVAKKNGLPYWNLFEAAGGNHSAGRWKKWGLLQKDGIHFTKNGYDLQGQLLFEAIVKGYNEYVRNRLSETH